MKKILFLFSIICLLVFACDKKVNPQDTQSVVEGKQTIYVDETLLPVIQDQVDVFESQYNAKITLVGKSETEIIQLLSEKKTRLAILTRKLSNKEAAGFLKGKLDPKVTAIATDAIAFVGNKNIAENNVNTTDVIKLMSGQKQNTIKGLVFDNANSSTVRYMKELAKVTELPKQNIFSFKTNNEVIDFVSKNQGMIGVVGVNWLLQPSPEMLTTISNVKVLGVNTKTGDKFVKPNQDDIATGLYPLTREVLMINYQGFAGLGMGFASFMSGEIGQRIILKSGLVPIRVPSRTIVIRNEIIKK
jgi:phosphate transport system substrate-binding protein